MAEVAQWVSPEGRTRVRLFILSHCSVLPSTSTCRVAGSVWGTAQDMKMEKPQPCPEAFSLAEQNCAHPRCEADSFWAWRESRPRAWPFLWAAPRGPPRMWRKNLLQHVHTA